MENQEKKTDNSPKSFGKSFITALIFGLIGFWLVRSCFSSDDPTRVFTLTKESGKLVGQNYELSLNLLDSNENKIDLKNKDLIKGYSARIFLFENDSWYDFKYAFNELENKNLTSCILDTTIQLDKQIFKKNLMKLNLPKKGNLNFSDEVYVAYQLIDPKGNIIGKGNADYDDFSFSIDQKKSSDYDITLFKEAIVVSDAKLARDYLESEISADEKYKNKLVEVSGRIDDLGKSFGSINYVLHGFELGVECQLTNTDLKAHKDKYINLKRGDFVTIRGYVSFAKQNVFLEKCIVK